MTKPSFESLAFTAMRHKSWRTAKVIAHTVPSITSSRTAALQDELA